MQKSLETIKSVIKEYLVSEGEKKDLSLTDETNLFDSGALDSLAIVKLVSFLEEKFSCTLDFEELNEETLACVNSIALLLQKKISS